MRSGRGQPDLVRLGLLVPDMNAWTQLQVREGERDLAWVLVPVISAALASSIADAHELGALSTCNSALGAASLASEAFAQAEAVSDLWPGQQLGAPSTASSSGPAASLSSNRITICRRS